MLRQDVIFTRLSQSPNKVFIDGTASKGQRYFIKAISGKDALEEIGAEARALASLKSKSQLLVPEVLALGNHQQWSFLILPWIEAKPATNQDWVRCIHGLAELHQNTAPLFGSAEVSFVGGWRHPEGKSSAWSEYFRIYRLIPIFEEVANYFEKSTRTLFDRVCAQLNNLLDDRKPALLHGDLWSGNIMFSASGAHLIDPACYYGHPEVDLAMLSLFGGAPGNLISIYENQHPLQPGVAERIPIYQLFYLLLHVKLFGASYVQSSKAILEAYK